MKNFLKADESGYSQIGNISSTHNFTAENIVVIDDMSYGSNNLLTAKIKSSNEEASFRIGSNYVLDSARCSNLTKDSQINSSIFAGGLRANIAFLKTQCRTTGMLLFSTIFLLLFTLPACVDNEVPPPSAKPKDALQGANPLEGTVWVHHPDTDPEGWKSPVTAWFNIWHSPAHVMNATFNLPNPVEISFLENGKIYEPAGDHGDQPYFYSYNEPYITIISIPQAHIFESVAEMQDELNLCPLTIDDYKCDPLKCNPKHGGNYLRCNNHYWYVGKVDGDAMHLQQIRKPDPGKYVIWRDVHLVKIK